MSGGFESRPQRSTRVQLTKAAYLVALENAQLKRLVADKELENLALREIVLEKW